MKGLKVFLIGVGIFFLVTIIIVVLLSLRETKKQQAETPNPEQMSIDEVRRQAGQR